MTGATTEELRRQRDAVTDADLVELRLDYVDRPDAAAALAGCRLPAIVTCRAAWEGGKFAGSEDERRRVLEAALDHGAAFVDVEAAAAFAPDLIRRTGGRRVVVSQHDFDGVPADIPARIAALRATGAEIAKLAVRVERLDQMLPFFSEADSNGSGRGHVLIAMGSAGLPSRILAARLGSRWTYAGDAIAPGQVSLPRLRRDFRFDRIAPDAALYGVVGRPITHSRSPIMHNAGFAALGINAAYVPLEAADAEDFVRFARGSGLQGASITTPFKVDLMRAVDHVDDLARRVGAINTLYTNDGRWIGSNTDVDGFLEPLLARTSPAGMRATILGAGGAARAAAIALADRGAAVTIAARRHDAAAAIAADTGSAPGAWPPPPGSWDLLVNATTLGSAVLPGNPMEGVALTGRIVYDLVYTPEETALLAQARRQGCDTIGGMDMLIAQAERQFELWTGQRPPAGLFRSVTTAA